MQLVILDRDGVINEDSDDYIKSPQEWHPVPGSIEAIAKLCQAGFTVAVATNQSGVGRGYYSLATLDAMHAKMRGLVEKAGGQIACIRFCPHTPDENCECRKPKPGLVRQIEKALNCDAKGAWFVGDTAKDMQVAQSCGCQPVLVKTGKGQRTLGKGLNLDGIRVVNNLLEFADFLTQD
ncbi:D-glycero-beta-D-manno-heptose 1,7-bisphosphate 7-phosphatase [Sansalvadorimonas verongulae]|uniref:D-glycero-beta-D-manno-heptose 1,7-bisphosphate 7-phosphatase n=1 Tax=Sansalvadorimonas verongulae TaxID=2172824 RepID=UPI0012BC9994|nr:D-glycero-beta-D-manno-heptose 1,7-bisphosphate 7-phosphatase [Sansalvadorimonas verongulae]MTI14172.1 D-glycero-beta-D-manno-heptose 1,7-bisphosphate 7-phosphatase [Sansalvadorimonas verongulae]